MKSSSRLFPARLMRAEVLDSCTEDTYLVKPNNSPDKQVEIAVTHLVPTVADVAPTTKPAIVLLHGAYQNRYFWYSPQGQGLATHLLSHFDVWLMETRGHGLSPVNQSYANNTLLDYGRYDIPAVNAFVAEKTDTLPIWVGHNEGMTSLLFALSSGSLLPEATQSVVGIGNPWLAPGWLKLPFAGQLQKIFLHGYHRQSERGPEPEPAHLIATHRAEQTLFASAGMTLGKSFWSNLELSGIPIAWLGSEAQLRLQHKMLQQIIGENKFVSSKLNDAANWLHMHQSAEAGIVSELLDAQLNTDLLSRGQGSDLLSPRETASTA